MSLNVPTALQERAEAGAVADADFITCVRDSLPYAWQVTSHVAEQLAAAGPEVEYVDHAVPPPTEQHRGELLRALASDAIRGGLERHFGVALAFQNCHRWPPSGRPRSAARRTSSSPRRPGSCVTSPRSCVTADSARTRGPTSWELFLVGAHGPDRTVRYAQLAEQAGFAGVWLAEHHFLRYGRTPSATVLAGHILGATARIAVGTAACVLSARHPVALGEEAALLDAVAPGRFRLGVARGGPWVELEVFGTGLERYRHGFAESLDLLRRWLSGAARVGAAGERFRFREVAVVPRPVRPVPLWVAATSPATVDLAAVRGLPLLLGVHEDEAGKQALLARYAATAAAHGVRPAAVPHASVHLGFAGDPARLRRRLAAWLATTGDYVRLDGAAPARDPDAYADRLLRIHPVGDPDECVRELTARARATGARHALLMLEGAGPTGTAAQIEVFGSLLTPPPTPGRS